jgi:hypothetical protein
MLQNLAAEVLLSRFRVRKMIIQFIALDYPWLQDKSFGGFSAWKQHLNATAEKNPTQKKG